MDESLYKTYQQVEEKHWWFRGRRALIFWLLNKYCRTPSKTAVLDVGCNSGLLVEKLRQAGYNAAGCDVSAEAVAYGREQGRQGLQVCALPNLPYADGQFDVILCLDTLEHIENDNLALREIRRALKQTGLVILTVPAFMSLWGLQDEVSHHFRRYTKAEMLAKIKASGHWQLARVSYFNFFLFLPIWLIRKISNILQLRRNSDFDINNQFLNKILIILFLSEIWLLKILSYPCGVSLLVAAQKK